jgi:hypothetical protein
MKPVFTSLRGREAMELSISAARSTSLGAALTAAMVVEEEMLSWRSLPT